MDNKSIAMSTSWTIKLDRLVDPRLLLDRGELPYTFLAFPATSVDQAGLPTDNDAKRYIVAVQSTGIPVGLWLDTPVEGTAYAFVGPADINRLHEVVEQLESEVFGRGFASELSDRLFQDCQQK